MNHTAAQWRAVRIANLEDDWRKAAHRHNLVLNRYRREEEYLCRSGRQYVEAILTELKDKMRDIKAKIKELQNGNE